MPDRARHRDRAPSRSTRARRPRLAGGAARATRTLADASVDDALRGSTARCAPTARRGATPTCATCRAERALVVAVGYGSGDARGRRPLRRGLGAAARRRPAVKRSMEAPEERFAALLGGRERGARVARSWCCAPAPTWTPGGPARPRCRRAWRWRRCSPSSDAGPRAELRRPTASVGDAANAALRGELGADELARRSRRRSSAMEARAARAAASAPEQPRRLEPAYATQGRGSYPPSAASS